MILTNLHVKHFRSILDESLPFDRLTAIVGRNGTGKSTFLRALELFYDPVAKATTDDFYAEDTTHDIEITVAYCDLSPEAKDVFSPYLDNDTLTVARIFSQAASSKSGTYHGMRLQNPDFAEIRGAGGKKEITAKYNDLKSTAKYQALPSVRSADLALEELQKWESANPAGCKKMRDDGQFFGFTQVGHGYLGRHTRFIRIPAVRDASEDSTDKKGSCITEIMDLVVRNVLARRKDLTDFKEQTQKTYKELLDPSKLKDLGILQNQLSETLKSYAPEASVSLQWMPLGDIGIPLPGAEVKLQEDGYESTVQRTGHGLQRAFILTMLQHLVAARSVEKVSDETGSPKENGASSSDIQLPGLILAIEEPELYQHPSRQRHIASVLLKLAKGTIPGVAKQTQVIYTTHSPLYVGLDRFSQIRVLRKVAHEQGKPKITRMKSTEIGLVAEELWRVNGQKGDKYTAETLLPRLQAVMTPWMNEGFFADVAVLVEGEDDRAAILGVAKAMNYDFDGVGIAVIPCLGKNNLDRPLVIFRNLAIPAYIVWDGDHGVKDAKPEDNRYILRLVGQPEEDWPNSVGDVHACFKVKLEKTLAEEIGGTLFDQLLSEAQEQLGIGKRTQALKNPVAIHCLIEKATVKGKSSTTLKSIVEKIIALKSLAAALK